MSAKYAPIDHKEKKIEGGTRFLKTAVTTRSLDTAAPADLQRHFIHSPSFPHVQSKELVDDTIEEEFSTQLKLAILLYPCFRHELNSPLSERNRKRQN